MSVNSVLFIAQPLMVSALYSQLKDAGYEVGLAESLSAALSFIEKSRPAIIFSKTRLPGFRIESLLGKAAEAMGDFPPIIAFTETGTAEEAKKLLELGARDYWLEPVPWEKVEAMLPAESAKDKEEPAPQAAPREEAAPKPAPRSSQVEIIGRHQAVLRVLALARQVAPSKATVLISGESGTGKEKFARFVHALSDRTDKPFVAINCAALPEHLLESELFGHEKGSFTGAINRKLGRFELAAGGTILLDEISEMDIGLQAKLLRVLQEGELDRVGGIEPIKVDVRVLATTNRNLEEYVKEGKFRQDLYYRLNVIPLKLPALKDRGDDVLLLAEYFVDNFTRDYKLASLDFSDEAREWLLSYDWPGNVRELQNLMERAVLLAGSGPIEKSHFLLDPDSWQVPDELLRAEECGAAPDRAKRPQAATGAAATGQTAAQSPAEAPSFEEVVPISEMEKRLILHSLDKTMGNRTQAAQLLGISVRTLRNKLNEYRKQGLDIP